MIGPVGDASPLEYNSIMITQTDQQAIRTICRKYGVKRALLFGSSLDETREARDIDIAVEGLAPRDFFRFYGDLIFALSKPVDVVDLSGDSKFLELVRREGVPLYG
jgi:predicted nucleotidyltransferase